MHTENLTSNDKFAETIKTDIHLFSVSSITNDYNTFYNWLVNDGFNDILILQQYNNTAYQFYDNFRSNLILTDWVGNFVRSSYLQYFDVLLSLILPCIPISVQLK